MERRHEDEMKLVLEELVDQGWAKVSWAKIYRWYGAERLSKNSYKDLYERLEEIINQPNIALSYIENSGGVAGNGHIVLFLASRVVNFKELFK